MIVASPESPKKTAVERVYVWEFPVRLTHWILFVAIIVLSVTGYYMGHPFIDVQGAAKDHFVMGTMITIHIYAAIFFIAAFVLRIYWFFVGNRYVRLGEYIPLSARRFHSLWNALLYYAFLRREPDYYAGHNALAAGSYAMIYVVYLLMIATGLVLYAVNTSLGAPIRVFDRLAPLFGGLPMTRLIHHIGMWIIWLFVVMHVYFVLLSSLIERIGTFDSIFSGYKFMPTSKADES
jgi:Ni/Fe-hydrogenase 1 B-type cytochrome subunit